MRAAGRRSPRPVTGSEGVPVGELGKPSVVVRGIEGLEGVPDLPVELDLANSRKAVVGSFPDQSVGEADATDHARNLRDDTRTDALVEQLENDVVV